MSRLKLLTAAALLASFVGGPPLTIAASASPVANAHEDRSDKRDRKEDKNGSGNDHQQSYWGTFGLAKIDEHFQNWNLMRPNALTRVLPV